MVKTETPPAGGGRGPLRIPTPIPARNASPSHLKPGGSPTKSWNRSMLSSSDQHGQPNAGTPPGLLSKRSPRSAFGGVGTPSSIPRPVYASMSLMSAGRGGHSDSDVGNRRFRRPLAMNPRINGYPSAIGPRLPSIPPSQSSLCVYSQGVANRSQFHVDGLPSLPSQLPHHLNKRQQMHLIVESKDSKPSPPMLHTDTSLPFATVFHRIFQDSPPGLPSGLVQRLERHETVSQGRVEVMLRICPTSSDELDPTSQVPFLDVDIRKKQLTVYEPTTSTIGPTEERHLGVTAPKMFAFDAIFSAEDSQSKVCSKALGDILPSVVSGSDACVFTYGYSKLGKSHTMIGTSSVSQDCGIVPCAISWLFKLINEQRQKTGARFSVRVSALAIVGKNETVKDLLSSYAKGTESHIFSPAMYLREEHGLGDHLQNQSELRAPSAEKAAFYLDAAIAASRSALKDSDGIMHFVFTLHVYQYRVDKSGKGAGVAGGRSRLYLVDLGGCEKQSQVFSYSRSYRVSLANLGNVILAIFNSQKHVPYKDSKLTQLLRDILGNVTCRAAMIAHISSSPAHYTDSLATMQLASRIHRLRHKKSKNMHQSSGVGSADDPLNRMHRRDGLRSSSSDVDCTSSSEQSCDTVIFVGPRERTLHEGVEVVPSVERRFGIVNPTQTSPLTPIAKPSFAQIRRTSTSTTEDSTHRVISGPGMGYHHSSPNGRQGGARLVDPLSKQQFYVCPERKGSINVQPPTYQASEHASSELTIDNINARTLKQMVSGTKSSCGEFWVDGPCVTSTKFSNVVQKDWSASKCPSPTSPSPNTETWVDGPRAQHCDYFLDEQKRAMIERWIDLQTSSFLSNETSEDALPPADFFLEHDRNYRATLDQDRLSRAGEAEIISNVDSFVSGDTETEKNNAWPVSHEGTMENLSNTVDSQWNEHCKSMEFYCHVVRHIGEVGDEEEPVEQETSRDDQREVKNLELGRAGENIVPVMDSWVQVTEFEIACECLSLADEANDEDDHPLRVLSSESLAISFADSSQMSWDSGLNAVRQAYAVTNRTADRSHISVGVGTDEKEDDDDKMDDRRRWSFEALSVQSDPGSGLSVSDICKSRFGSRSLESLDKPCVLDTQQCCDGERRRGHDDHKVCIQCNCDLLRRPDGTSTSRFEYHHSSIEWDLVEAEDGNCRACEKHVKTEMYRDSYGDDLQVDDGDVSEPSKESCRSQLGFYSCLVDQGKMKDDKQLLKLNSGRVKPTAFKTTMSFCCAVGMTQKGGNGRGSSNSSSSSSTESPSRRDKGFKSQVSRCQMLSDDWNGDRPKGFQKYGDRLDDHEASQM